MIDHAEWLDHARFLLQQSPGSQADVRRTISAAYYAVWHAIGSECVKLLQVPAGSSGAALVQRSLSHERLRQVAGEVIKPNPARTLRPFWPSSGFGSSMKVHARWVIDLQYERHRADYDPSATFTLAYAESIVNSAALAVEQLVAAPDDERTTWLMLVMLRPHA